MALQPARAQEQPPVYGKIIVPGHLAALRRAIEICAGRLPALFVQVRWTDVGLTAVAVRFDGAAGTTASVTDETALAVDTVDKAAITAKATTTMCLRRVKVHSYAQPRSSACLRWRVMGSSAAGRARG